MKKLHLFVFLIALLGIVTVGAFAQHDDDGQHDDEFLPLVETTGGPDAYGYVWSTSDEPTCNYNWISLGATSPLPDLMGSDNGEATVLLDEPFPFYGQDYETLYMSANGHIATEPGTFITDLTPNCPLPQVPDRGGGARMYAMHTNLTLGSPNSTVTGNGFARYYPNCPRNSNSGAEPCTVFIWDDIAFVDTVTGNNFDIQAVLYHDSGEVVYQYNNGADGDGIPNQLSDLGGLGSARQTYGIQNETAQFGIAAACGGTFEHIINAGDALCFRRQPIMPDRVPLGQQTQVPQALYWRDIPGEEWYNINVTGMGANYDMWFHADEVCTFAVDWCYIPIPVYNPGSYNWTISYWQEARGTVITGSTTQFGFSGAPLGQVNRITPVDGTTVNGPISELVWQPDPNALWYNVQLIDSANTVVLNQWYEHGAACNFSILSGGPNSLGYCRAGWIVPPTTGTYTWRMQGWGPAGFGPTNDTTFTVGTYAAPTAANTVRDPGDASSVQTNAFTLLGWVRDPQATWYNVIITGPGINENAWYHVVDICLVHFGICYYYTNDPIQVGNYTWTIQSWNPQGFGPENDTTTFTITP